MNKLLIKLWRIRSVNLWWNMSGQIVSIKYNWKSKWTLSLTYLLESCHFSSNLSFNSGTQAQSKRLHLFVTHLRRAAFFYPDWLVRISYRIVTARPDNKLQTTSFCQTGNPRLVAAQLGTRVQTLPNHWTFDGSDKKKSTITEQLLYRLKEVWDVENQNLD